MAAVYILREKATVILAGFYTLSMYAVQSTDLPEEFRRKQPRYEYIPTVLIGRLAIDTRFGRRGLGTQLLMNALERSYQVSQEVAALAVVVDAKNDRVRH